MKGKTYRRAYKVWLILSGGNGVRVFGRIVFIARHVPQRTITLFINWSTSELNTLLDPTTYLDYTDSWIQLVTAPTLAVTSWIQLSTCIVPSTCTGGPCPLCPIRI